MLTDNFYLNTFLIFLGAYLIGSFPTAYIAGRIKGIDISRSGNKNVGGTNALFILGKPLGITVIIIDIGKGLLIVWLSSLFSDHHQFIPMLAVVFTTIGHNWMFAIRFKGGKGTGVLVGSLLYLSPLSIPVLFLVFIPLASFLVKDSFLGVGIGLFLFSFFMWAWEGNYYWCLFLILITIAYSLRCLDLYITYFTEKRRYLNPFVRMILKPFLGQR
jgi:acyl phosphate:glycerol-3-phosphate acyltransferase